MNECINQSQQNQIEKKQGSLRLLVSLLHYYCNCDQQPLTIEIDAFN